MSSGKFKLCLTSIDSEASAERLAKKLLQKKLVACVNITSRMKSLYHWQGRLAESEEYLLLMKTASHKVEALEEQLLEVHPYDIPEFIQLDIESGATDYLNWINSVLS